MAENNFPVLASRGVNGLHLFDNLDKKSSLSWAPESAQFYDKIPEKKFKIDLYIDVSSQVEHFYTKSSRISNRSHF